MLKRNILLTVSAASVMLLAGCNNQSGEAGGANNMAADTGTNTADDGLIPGDNTITNVTNVVENGAEAAAGAVSNVADDAGNATANMTNETGGNSQ